jgi:hypothetical protein
MQDRFVKDLKFADVKTLEWARKYLEDVYIPKHNKKFSVCPEFDGDMHRELSTTYEELYWIFSLRSQRVVKNDYTIQYKKTYAQLDNVWRKTNEGKQDQNYKFWHMKDMTHECLSARTSPSWKRIMLLR